MLDHICYKTIVNHVINKYGFIFMSNMRIYSYANIIVMNITIINHAINKYGLVFRRSMRIHSCTNHICYKHNYYKSCNKQIWIYIYKQHENP